MSRLLLISLGTLTGAVLEGLARSRVFSEILVASRSPEKASKKVNNARIGGAIEGYFPEIRAVGFDLNAEDAGRRLSDLAPDLVFAAPSLMPWWALERLPEPRRSQASAVPFGGFVACHLAPMLRLRDAWAASGLSGPWVGASYPDVVNTVLAADGPAPTCGIGNVAEAVPKIQFAAAAAGVSPGEVSVKLVAQHAFQYFLYSDQSHAEGAAPPFLLDAKVGDRDISGLAREALFAPMPIPYELDLNRITASAAKVVLEALVSERPVATHVPAPAGRLGGYPVRVSRAGVTLDLPPDWSIEAAEDVNRRSLPWDGIAAVDADGTIRFTDDTAAALKTLVGRTVESLKPAEAQGLAEEIVASLR